MSEHTHTYTCTHTHVRRHTYAYVRMHTRMCMHTHMHACTHNTHTHTHTNDSARVIYILCVTLKMWEWPVWKVVCSSKKMLWNLKLVHSEQKFKCVLIVDLHWKWLILKQDKQMYSLIFWMWIHIIISSRRKTLKLMLVWLVTIHYYVDLW